MLKLVVFAVEDVQFVYARTSLFEEKGLLWETFKDDASGRENTW
jgi:hypothetical protein